MLDDPIVAETRKAREAYAASFAYDLGKIVADLQSRQGKDGRRLVDRTSQQTPEQSAVPNPPVVQVLNDAPTSAAGSSSMN